MDKKIASWTELQTMIVKSVRLLEKAKSEIYHLMSELGDNPFHVGCFSEISKFINEINDKD